MSSHEAEPYRPQSASARSEAVAMLAAVVGRL